MKIAVEKYYRGLWLIAFGLVLASPMARAANEPTPPPPVVEAPSMDAPTTKSEATFPPPPSAEDAKSSSHETKIPDSVREVVKHLNASTEDITLDDLNAAREAVAKLDALIDIEKRLADLEKLRQERENKSSLASAIPSSALNISSRVANAAQAAPSSMPPMMPMMSSDMITVERVEGSAGHYTAFVKEPDGVKSVHTGDHLMDGSTVIAVMAEGIELEKGKTTHLVMIKNVQTVFGNTP